MSQTTTLTLDKKLPVVHTVREFNAKVSVLFRAHVDPELFVRWTGPHELTTTLTKWEAHTGGSWAYASVDGEGNAYAFYGSFHEVRKDEVIVHTLSFAGFPDAVTMERFTFESLEDGRSRLTVFSLFDSFESRDAMIASGMEQGIVESHEKLDAALSEL